MDSTSLPQVRGHGSVLLVVLAGIVLSAPVAWAARAPANKTLDTYSITASAGSHGQVTPAGTAEVNQGDSVAYAIAADSCWHVAEVLVDNLSMGPVGGYTFTNVAANHTIDATFAVDVYTITASAGTGGAITPSGVVAVDCGGTQAFAIGPVTGYQVLDVRVDEVSVGATTSYTFANVTANHTIAASFTINTYTIIASAGAHGQVSPAGATEANYGDSVAYAIAADACWHAADVLVDGVSVGPVSSYAFTKVVGNHTIAASFAVDVHTITASAGTGGAITPSGAVAVACGEAQAFTITPDGCHTPGDLLVDGSSVGAVTSYTFGNAAAGHSIVASFVAKPYSISTSTGAGGSIAPSGAVTSPGVSVEFAGNALPSGWASYAWQAGGGVAVSGGVLAVEGARANPDPYLGGPGRSMEFVATFSPKPFQAGGLGAGNQQPPDEIFGLVQYAVFSTGSQGTSLITRVFESTAPVDFAILGNWIGMPHRFRVDWNPGTVGFYIDGNLVHTEPLNFNGSMRPAFSDYLLDGTPLVVDWVHVSPYTFDCGSSPLFSIVPDAGFHLVQVKVDGGSVGAVTSYPFDNLAANHTLTATFAANVLAVEPPVAPHLALAGLRPNPAFGPVNVMFSLPNAGPARIELVDLSGRIVRSQDVGSLGLGQHVVTLGSGRAMAAGVYWLRLTQGARAITSKATIVH